MNGFTPPPALDPEPLLVRIDRQHIRTRLELGMVNRRGTDSTHSVGPIAVPGRHIGPAHTLGPGGTVGGLLHSGQGIRNGAGRIAVGLLVVIGSVALCFWKIFTPVA